MILPFIGLAAGLFLLMLGTTSSDVSMHTKRRYQDMETGSIMSIHLCLVSSYQLASSSLVHYPSDNTVMYA
ncbi:hypothetical protein [Exiguobacterium sp. K1]|uniref:hypothetical protein n=1 Tax=Exiguobacterium sp. K1 TaxID=2980105 RepID=UPI00299EBAA4|nr:hypothetical protein [Exiguobacterium sp. K1]MDX1259164.1 hypothetical protein [Exiguobacterium sp. K1]